MLAHTSSSTKWQRHAVEHLVCARGVAARDGDACAPVLPQQAVEVSFRLCRNVAAAAEQLDVADAVRCQVPARRAALSLRLSSRVRVLSGFGLETSDTGRIRLGFGSGTFQCYGYGGGRS